MKKIRFESVEILGYIGIFLWVAVILLRKYPMDVHSLYLFWLGIPPNLAAAWAMTMFAKWGVLYILKRRMTVKIHFCICVVIFFMALMSELIHDMFLDSPFDIFDILITAVAQLCIFLTPLITKDFSK